MVQAAIIFSVYGFNNSLKFLNLNPFSRRTVCTNPKNAKILTLLFKVMYFS